MVCFYFHYSDRETHQPGTPNNHPIAILLEELKKEYGLQYTCQTINIRENVQKDHWFTSINPNGRVPVIVDHDNNDRAVFESAAISSYLVRKYDTKKLFTFDFDTDEYTDLEVWLAWAHGSLSPMQGQANLYVWFLQEKIPFPIQRYVGEVERLYGVLDKTLEESEYVVGGKYTIVDMTLVSLANFIRLTTVTLDSFPNVKRWFVRCLERDGVKEGFKVPFAPFTSALREMPPELEKQVEELSKVVKDAKEKYA